MASPHIWLLLLLLLLLVIAVVISSLLFFLGEEPTSHDDEGQQQHRLRLWNLDQTDDGDDVSLRKRILLTNNESPTAISTTTMAMDVVDDHQGPSLLQQRHHHHHHHRQLCYAWHGQHGHWVQDWEFAQQFGQFQKPLLHPTGEPDRIFHHQQQQRRKERQMMMMSSSSHRMHDSNNNNHRKDEAAAADNNASFDTLFRRPTTWRWQPDELPLMDRRPSSSSSSSSSSLLLSCPMHILTRTALCDVLQRMNVTRIFFLGDSLTLQQGLSLWMLLYPSSSSSLNDEYDPQYEQPLQDESSFSFIIKCPVSRHHHSSSSTPTSRSSTMLLADSNGRIIETTTTTTTTNDDVHHHHHHHQFELQFVRNDELWEPPLDTVVSVPKRIKNCHSFCYPWKDAYRQRQGLNWSKRTTTTTTISSGRTIMVVNTGSHLHDSALFESSIQRFLNDLHHVTVNHHHHHHHDDQHNQQHQQHYNHHKEPPPPNHDIIMIRTLVPGHKRCDRYGLVPFQSFADYEQDVQNLQDEYMVQNHNNDNNGDDATTKRQKGTYNWHTFAAYNEYIHHMVKQEQQEQQSSSSSLPFQLDILDVFPMTVLRPDGHMADEYKAPFTKRNDCLHYAQPGPMDWWNHLLFTKLRDLASMEEEEEEE